MFNFSQMSGKSIFFLGRNFLILSILFSGQFSINSGQKTQKILYLAMFLA